MASGSDDTFAWFSNYGSCAHIIAPVSFFVSMLTCQCMPLASYMQGVDVKTVGNVVDSGKSNSLKRFPMHDDRRMYMNMYLYAHMYRNIVFLPDCGKQIISCMC